MEVDLWLVKLLYDRYVGGSILGAIYYFSLEIAARFETVGGLIRRHYLLESKNELKLCCLGQKLYSKEI